MYLILLFKISGICSVCTDIHKFLVFGPCAVFATGLGKSYRVRYWALLESECLTVEHHAVDHAA